MMRFWLFPLLVWAVSFALIWFSPKRPPSFWRVARRAAVVAVGATAAATLVFWTLVLLD